MELVKTEQMAIELHKLVIRIKEMSDEDAAAILLNYGAEMYRKGAQDVIEKVRERLK